MQPVDTEERVADRYTVLGVLGRGGMGSVYRVRDQRDGREIALKRLSKDASRSAVTAALFEREFHTLSELAHPCIIEVYDYGIDENGAYYTMELLGGQDLRALGRVPWREACALLRDVSSSLAIVHSRRLLHADLSPRNVRCTMDGRAKLLDFGAMAPMGVAKRVVGTPPFIAPEMVQLQALDARTDLYALGALGYFLLTGRHAYPAASVSQLRDRWRTAPPSPSLIDPEIPEPLSELVLELLQLNRNARPRSAGVVMERLCAIAGLPLDEQADVAQAYLTTPALVGRDAQLAKVRERLMAMLGGRGCTIVAQGSSGSGRSRFLDACVLEAKLLGAQVIRGDRSDAESQAYGLSGTLGRQLFELAPDAARRAARLHAPALAHVLGAELVGSAPSSAPPDRRAVQLALRDCLLSVARSSRVVVAVDDADHIDDASIGLLIALAQKAPRRSLCLILTVDAEGEGSAALDAVAKDALQLDLPALTEEQTEQLLGSVFGGAKHTFTVARSLHTVAHGSPRAIMQLAAHLVEQGIARYEAGSFVLPDRLLPEELPSSVAAALARRVTQLDPDALELGRALALTDPRELPIADYIGLTSHGDRARTYRAIDALVRIQMLEPHGERYRLGDLAWRSALCDELPEQERAALHARLARVFEPSGTIARRSHHLMEAGEQEAAIRLLLTRYLEDPNEPPDPLEGYVPGMLDLLERAATAAEELKLPLPWQVELRMKVAGASQYVSDLPRFSRTAFPLLALLERESGLAEYQALDPNLESMARLTEALTRVQQRYDAAAEGERGLAPVEAIRELSRLCAMFVGMSSVAQDPALLERLPSLAPFVPLSPAIAVIQQLIDASREIRRGRDAVGCEQLLALARRVAEPDGAGLGALYATSMRLGALQAVGLVEAGMGIPDASKRVAELESTPGWRVNAYRVQMACHLMQGDSEAAAAAQRRAERVMVQDGQVQRYPGMTVRTEIFAYWLAGDAAGLKEVTERTTRLAQRYPAWQTLVDIGRCLHKHLQGDHAGALAALEPALAAAQPGVHREWAWAATCQVQVLAALGEAERAAGLGVSYMEICEREALSAYARVAQATAEALIAAGRPQQGAELAERLIEAAQGQGVRGIVLGALYELRAQAAAASGDLQAFETWLARCAAEYRLDRNPALLARYERLHRHGGTGRASLSPPRTPDRARVESDTTLSIVQSRLEECTDEHSRARCVLTVLTEQTQAERAYLYVEREGELSLLQAIPEDPPPAALQGALERYLEHELGQDKATVLEDVSDEAIKRRLESEETSDSLTGRRWSSLPPSVASGGEVLAHPSGLRIFPLLLVSESAGERAIVGVAALATRAERLPAIPRALGVALATALLEHDDVDPMTCVM